MTRFFHPGLRTLAGVIGSAALFGWYARGGNAYVLGFVALVPWLLVLDTTSTLAGAARSGVAMSIAFVAAVFAWFGVAIGAYTGIGAGTGLFVVLAAAPLLQLQILVFALVRHRVGRRYGLSLRALAGASAWVATEWLVPKLLGDTIGHGVFPSLQLRQIADVGGAAGITFLLILINEAIAAAIAHRRDGARALVRPLAIAGGVLALMTGYGLIRLSTLTAPHEGADRSLRIGMVQSNIVDYERLRQEMGAYAVVRHVLDTHYAMSREAIDTHYVDALLWSETVYPTTFAHPKSEDGDTLDREILDFVSAAGVPLVFGTYDRDAAGEYNAAAFVEPKSGPIGFYRKTDPFPLTEYVPRWLDGPTFRRWLPWTGTWQPGSGARVFPLRLTDGREIPVLPMICLDDVDSRLAIDGARQGAQVILGMSNDSWFTAHPVGARLHLSVAAFRSIETRLPQLRVTANGVSAAIDVTGTVVASTAMSEQTLLIGEVSVRQPPATLMVAWGDWVGRAGLVFLLLIAAFSAMQRLRRRHARKATTSADSTLHETQQQTQQGLCADVAVLTPGWRIAAGLLQIFSSATLLWMGVGLLLQDSTQTNPLSQIEMFAALFLVPMAAAWCITRAFAGTLRVEGNVMVIDQRERRIEIRTQDIAAVKPWRLPLPTAGVWLRVESDTRWSHGIALADPAALATALIRAGAQPAIGDTLTGRAMAYARACAAVPHRVIDHPVLKFILFPLVPALPAFRLHQHIAFGGTFGEYYTFGLKVYLIALGIWWATWAIGLVLYAAALRIVIEASTLLSLILRPERAIDIRKALEILGRWLYYLGVPAWLLARFWSG